MVPKKLLAALRKKENKRFLIAAHIHLEGDALGSELALARLLRRLGKKVFVVNDDVPPAEYAFLPDIRSIHHGPVDFDYDVAILVDCSDKSRIGKVIKAIPKGKPILNIDHHISNTEFGDINWVKPDASSASEMIYEIFVALGLKIKKPEALLLYTGIMTDTGSFKYGTTSAFTHQVAGALITCGLDVYGIYRALNESMDYATVRALGDVIRTLKLSPSGKLAWVEARQKLIGKSATLSDMTDDMIQFARSIKGVEVALLFKEIVRSREVRINMRSRGKVDVNKLAQLFGGGGHKMASGCTIKGTFKDVVKRVIAEAKKRGL